MYDPLLCNNLCDFFFLALTLVLVHITNFDQATTRKFQKTNKYAPNGRASHIWLPEQQCRSHNFYAWNGCAYSQVMAGSRRFWPSNKQGPKPATPGAIPPIVTQSADYAHPFMSARPFMLFSVGILIFGTGFWIGIYDRDGVTFMRSNAVENLNTVLLPRFCMLRSKIYLNFYISVPEPAQHYL